MEEMKERIVEKLDAEYECFFQDMLRTSKENLFANSYEIETKKTIQKTLRNTIMADERFAEEDNAKTLIYTNNLMETCYRFASDHKELDPVEVTRKILYAQCSL